MPAFRQSFTGYQISLLQRYSKESLFRHADQTKDAVMPLGHSVIFHYSNRLLSQVL